MTTATGTDPRPMFHRAVDQAEQVISTVRPDQLAGTTPCADFDVRTLLGHLVAGLRRLDTVGSGGAALDVPRVISGIPDDGWAEAYRDAHAATRRTWANDDVLDRTLSMPFGEAPGRGVLGVFTFETAVHSWDLASAIGYAEPLDADVGDAALAAARARVPAEPRGGPVPFAPVVPVPDDAGVYERLAGWLGRVPA